MAGLNLSGASNILKTRYIGTVREQLNNATVLLNKIGRQDQMLSGTNFTVPLHTGRNTSAGTALDDGGTLPTAGAQTYATTIVPNKYLYGRIQVTGPTIAATRDNVGAFVEALNSEVDGLMRDFKREFNRQLNGDGTGALAYIAAAYASTDTTGTVDDNSGNAFTYLPAGQLIKVDVIDTTDDTTILASDVSCTLGAVGTTTYTITLTPGEGNALADGDWIIKTGTRGLEMMGIDGIISDSDVLLGSGTTSLQGLAVASNTFWKAQYFGNSGTKRALAFEDIQEVIDAIATNTDYDENSISFMFSNYGVRRAYYKLCIAERRHVNTMELDGGWKAVDFNGIGWVVDAQATRNKLRFINTDTMKIYRTADFDWMDKDGSYLSRVANADAYEAVLFHYGNLAVLSRNGNGCLADILEA